MRIRIFIFSVQVMIFLTANAYMAYASTVVLKSGKILTGTIQEKTDKEIKIMAEGGGSPETYSLDEVESIAYSFAPNFDMLVLKSGKRINGIIRGKTDKEIKITTQSGSSETYPLDEVESIAYAPTDTTPNPAIPDLVDRNNPEYPEIYKTIENFARHETDDDPSEALRSISKNFSCDDWKNPGQVLDYDKLKSKIGGARLREGDTPCELMALEGVYIDLLEISGDSANAQIQVIRRLRDLPPSTKESLKIKLMAVSLKKEGDGWKIISLKINLHSNPG